MKTQLPSPVHSAALQRFQRPPPHSPQWRQESAKHSGGTELERPEEAEELDLGTEEEMDALLVLLTTELLRMEEMGDELRVLETAEAELMGQHPQPPTTPPRPRLRQHWKEPGRHSRMIRGSHISHEKVLLDAEERGEEGGEARDDALLDAVHSEISQRTSPPTDPQTPSMQVGTTQERMQEPEARLQSLHITPPQSPLCLHVAAEEEEPLERVEEAAGVEEEVGAELDAGLALEAGVEDEAGAELDAGLALEAGVEQEGMVGSQITQVGTL
ncbi:hypothetical protein A2881_02900 [Candidatus Peribacteria bacterium RIFCSPHIGHO2_01_FULL_55_13]|nr:MAG: hypothetical protein A2881_02900 [Candidatus Peribacteria bacterium RIFCSPHIGHO2_01_FULL_55_13]OGJ65142.1 MAG: hypothetical protein A3F36_02350 [Candidatus Peribacteria bacterium RIFCSPHIGHO2_12_FULL_55_11]